MKKMRQNLFGFQRPAGAMTTHSALPRQLFAGASVGRQRVLSVLPLVALLFVGCKSRAPAQDTGAAPLVSTPTAQLGPADRALTWTPEQQQAGYGNMDKLYAVRTISRTRRESVPAFPLPDKPRDLSRLSVEGRYSIADFRERYRSSAARSCSNTMRSGTRRRRNGPHGRWQSRLSHCSLARLSMTVTSAASMSRSART
jgi:hypothetical protein